MFVKCHILTEQLGWATPLKIKSVQILFRDMKSPLFWTFNGRKLLPWLTLYKRGLWSIPQAGRPPDTSYSWPEPSEWPLCWCHTGSPCTRRTLWTYEHTTDTQRSGNTSLKHSEDIHILADALSCSVTGYRQWSRQISEWWNLYWSRLCGENIVIKCILSRQTRFIHAHSKCSCLLKLYAGNQYCSLICMSRACFNFQLSSSRSSR